VSHKKAQKDTKPIVCRNTRYALREKRMIIRLVGFICALVALVIGGMVVSASAQAHDHKEAVKDVRSRIFKQVMADFPEVRDCVAQEEGGARAAEEKMSVEEVDLNRDGASEYDVELGSPCVCGMVNCLIWVYRQSPGGFELILDGASGFGLQVLKTATSGYADLRVDSRNNAATQDQTIFKYDGKQYREANARLVEMQTGRSKPAYRRVQFKRGTSSTTLQGRASMTLPDTYVVGARAGQTITVTLTAPRSSVTFMLMTARTTDSLANDTRSWTGTLPETGDYIIVVDGDEKGGMYSMTITIK
jgi:hypothetical protein